MKKPIIELIGSDGNAFAIMGKVQRTAKMYNMDWDKIQKEMTEGDYAHLLSVVHKYFEVI